MKNNHIIAICTALFLAASCATPGELSPWREGNLDIHTINTGRGESMFYVFPDGTTMLVDAAGSLLKKHKYMPTAPKRGH